MKNSYTRRVTSPVVVVLAGTGALLLSLHCGSSYVLTKVISLFGILFLCVVWRIRAWWYSLC